MTLSFNDYRWRLDPKVDAEEIRRILECFPRLETLPGAQVIKENQLRTVVYVPSGSREQGGVGGISPPSGDPHDSRSEPPRAAPAVIAKHYRYRSASERLRYSFRRTRAEQEWFALGRFRDLGLPAAAPLGIAQLRRGTHLEAEGVLLEYLAGCRSLVEALEADGDKPGLPVRRFLPPGELCAGQRATIELAARWVRKLHDQGAWHRDLHAGNLLVDAQGDRLFFVDLHSCWFWRRLGRWQRRHGVLDLLYSLSWSTPPEGIDVFLEAYGRDVLYGGARAEIVRRRVRRALEARNRKRLRSRSKRCFVRSTMFDVATEASTRTYHLRRYARKDLSPLWTRDPPGRILKRSRHGWVAEARSGRDDVCLKYRAYTWLESLRSLIGSHRLRRAYAIGHGLWVRRVATPQVIALHERRRLGCVREAYLVTELIPRGVPVHRYLMDHYWGRPRVHGPSGRRKHELARRLGRFVREIHDARLYPRDFSPQNVLVVEDLVRSEEREPAARDENRSMLYVVDLDDAHFRERLSPRERAKGLVQVGNLPEGHVSTVDLLRGLRAYACGDARYWNQRWILELRESLLEEHLRVVLRRTANTSSEGST